MQRPWCGSLCYMATAAVSVLVALRFCMSPGGRRPTICRPEWVAGVTQELLSMASGKSASGLPLAQHLPVIRYAAAVRVHAGACMLHAARWQHVLSLRQPLQHLGDCRPPLPQCCWAACAHPARSARQACFPRGRHRRAQPSPPLLCRPLLDAYLHSGDVELLEGTLQRLSARETQLREELSIAQRLQGTFTGAPFGACTSHLACPDGRAGALFASEQYAVACGSGLCMRRRAGAADASDAGPGGCGEAQAQRADRPARSDRHE